MTAVPLVPSRLLPGDILRVGSLGLRSRRMRAALSGLGIAIGVASLVAVLGISASSQANLLAEIEALGTNLLTVAPGQAFTSSSATLPPYSPAKVRSLPGVYAASAVFPIVKATIRRNQYVNPNITSGINLLAAEDSLRATLSGAMAAGTFLNTANDRYPTMVLGSLAAQRLGIDTVTGAQQLYVSGHWFTLIGILGPLTLAPEINSAALIGVPLAKTLYGKEANSTAISDPGTIYLRAETERVGGVYARLAATADPAHPAEVQISRPSDTLEARAKAKGAFTSLFLGLGLVALLVGAVGIANVMVISVLERRSEIGLRRALGATSRHIAWQFITESLLLALLGGIAGIAIGILVTLGYATLNNLPTSIPALGVFGGLAAALLTGAIAGLYPAVRAARLSPTQALRTT
jgi:putative ABC transport system permease protein